MFRLQIISLFAIIILSSSFLFGQDIPLWVSYPEEVYSSKEYLFAIGQGKSKQEAREIAITNLSNQISSDVSSTSSMHQAQKVVVGDDSNNSSYDEFFSTSTNIESTTKLINVNVLYHNNSLGYFDAIAVLEKSITLDVCKITILDNEDDIKLLLKNTSSKLPMIGNLSKAKNLSDDNLALYNLVAVINPAEANNLNITRPVIVQDKINEIRNSLSFIVVTNNDMKLQSCIELFVTDKGFTISKENPAFMLQANIDFDTINTSTNRKSVRWFLDLNLFENNIQVGSYSLDGLKHHSSYQQAKRVVYKKIPDKLVKLVEFNKLFGL